MAEISIARSASTYSAAVFSLGKGDLDIRSISVAADSETGQQAHRIAPMRLFSLDPEEGSTTSGAPAANLTCKPDCQV